MKFVSFVILCVIAAQAFFGCALAAAGKEENKKAVEQFHEEFMKAGTQLHTALKTARNNAELKSDTHAQAVLNAIEEADAKIEQLEKNWMDPNQPLSESERQQLRSGIKTLVKKIKSEGKYVKRENRQSVRLVIIDLAKRGILLKAIATKQRPDLGKEHSEESANPTF